MGEQRLWIDKSSETSLVVCPRCGYRRLFWSHAAAKADRTAHSLWHYNERKRELRGGEDEE